MIETRKLHAKFRGYWPEYHNRDIIEVCKAIVQLMELKAKSNHIQVVKNNWGKVCEFLIRWEGHKR
jgi:hypothetical protein